jgi:hypothetical protein
MGVGDRIRRVAGWCFVGLVTALIGMGYHFGNVRFVPVAAGFAILAGLCFLQGSRAAVRSNAIHPGADSRVRRASG